jgi:transposase
MHGWPKQNTVVLPNSKALPKAFSSPWSNGQVEVQVNRLKLIKRQMFGRAQFDLLRLRVLHGA